MELLVRYWYCSQVSSIRVAVLELTWSKINQLLTKLFRLIIFFQPVSALHSSKSDGSGKCPADTGSTVGLRVTATSSPMSLQEHEVLRWHQSTRWVRPHAVEDVHAELEAHAISGTDRNLLGKVRE